MRVTKLLALAALAVFAALAAFRVSDALCLERFVLLLFASLPCDGEIVAPVGVFNTKVGIGDIINLVVMADAHICRLHLKPRFVDEPLAPLPLCAWEARVGACLAVS